MAQRKEFELIDVPSELEEKIHYIKKIRRKFNPATDVLSFVHYKKKHTEEEIKTSWFDVSVTENVVWFLFQQIIPTQKEDENYTHYSQIKLENVDNFKMIPTRSKGGNIHGNY